MRETRSYGSVRGATREGCPYRNPKPGETVRLKGRYLLQSLKQYRDASLTRLVGKQVDG